MAPDPYALYAESCRVALALAAALSGLAYGASPGARFNYDGISFRVPKNWHLTIGRVNGVVDPVTVFTVSTFRLQLGVPSSGLCSSARGALTAPTSS